MSRIDHDRTDSLEEAIWTALRERVPTAPGMRTLEIREGDLAAEPLGPGGYDLVCSAMGLHHVADVPAALVRIRKALRPGGLLAIAELVREDGAFHADNAGVAHFGFDPGALASRVEEAGFRVLEIEPMHTVEKAIGPGDIRAYPVFLLLAER